MNGLTPGQDSELTRFLAEHGWEGLQRAMAVAHLVPETLGASSALALRHSGDFSAAELSHSVIFRVQPKSKVARERVDVTLVTGDAPLLVELPRGRS